MIKKIVPVSFPLTTQAGRVALLAGIMSGYVGKQEIAAAITQDMEPRPVRKPITVFNRRHDSVVEAAHYLYRTRPEMHGTKAGVRCDQHAVVSRIAKRISKWATRDNVVGCYWCV